MREVTFTTTPRFTELGIESALTSYIVRYLPDGGIMYLVNLKPVDHLPVTPLTRVLLLMADRVQADIKRLFTLPFDGPDYRALWWAIKEECEDRPALRPGWISNLDQFGGAA